MKKKLKLISFLICIVSISLAQDPVPNLILSEASMFCVEDSYVEITNIGSTPADLSRVVLSNAQGGEFVNDTTGNCQWLTNAPMLAPGESYTVFNWETQIIDTTIVSTPKWYFEFMDHPLLYTYRVRKSALRNTGGNNTVGLFYDIEGDWTFDRDIDTLLDVVGNQWEDTQFDVAGVTNASYTHLLVRKANVSKGNLGNWGPSAGLSAEDSEWIPIPYNPDRLGTCFSTVGMHTDTCTWNFSLKEGTIVENEITLPWGAWRDSIYKAINVGENMAWYVRWAADTANSNVVQTGDSLFVYLCGDTVETRKYHITVSEPAENNNTLFPRLYTVPYSYDAFSMASTMRTPYRVTEGDPVIDTLFDMTYNTRIDTVYKYIEIASNAKMEYNTFDGVTRAGAKTGDKLVVEAKNGDKKEYFIKTDVYSPSDNADLVTILIDNDTLWNFASSKLSYNITLSKDATQFPSISATAEHNDARVVINQPTYFRGTEDDRTATIVVYSENDTTYITYSLVFDLARDTEPNILDPFISQIVAGSNHKEHATEFFNPSNVPISLADYMAITTNSFASLEAAISVADTSGDDRESILNMGYIFDKSRSEEGVFFKEVTNYNIDMEPYGVWWIKKEYSGQQWGGTYDFVAGDIEYMGFPDGDNVGNWTDGKSHWLLKMTNDSIPNGWKSADDPDDYEFLDIWGTVGEPFDHTRTIEGRTLRWKWDQHFIRKGHIIEGNSDPYGSIAENEGEGSSEWFVVDGEDYEGPQNDVGRHSGFIKPTAFISTVSSASYVVSAGYGADESIEGVVPGSTVTVFLGNIIKAGPGQALALMAADGSGERGLSATVLKEDTLVVQSEDLKNTTRYAISTDPLSNDALLSSDIYDIAVSGTTGTIGTIPSFTTINEVFSHLTLPAGAFMNIIDNQRRHVPLLHLTPDTLIEVDPFVNDSIFIEVIAEDGITKILYSMAMEDPTEPYITSNVYYVYQGAKVIDLWVYNTNINKFLFNVIPSKGANIKVYDKYDYQRTEGNMYIDDRVVVTDQNLVSVTYTLHEFFDTIAVVETSVEDFSNPNEGLSKIKLYPNPAANMLNVSGLERGSKIAVINLLGAIIEIREAYSGITEIDISDYSSGVYFLRVIKDQKYVTHKFIKQ